MFFTKSVCLYRCVCVKLCDEISGRILTMFGQTRNVKNMANCVNMKNLSLSNLNPCDNEGTRIQTADTMIGSN